MSNQLESLQIWLHQAPIQCNTPETDNSSIALIKYVTTFYLVSVLYNVHSILQIFAWIGFFISKQSKFSSTTII